MTCCSRHTVSVGTLMRRRIRHAVAYYSSGGWVASLRCSWGWRLSVELEQLVHLHRSERRNGNKLITYPDHSSVTPRTAWLHALETQEGLFLARLDNDVPTNPWGPSRVGCTTPEIKWNDFPDDDGLSVPKSRRRARAGLEREIRRAESSWET